MAAIIGDSWGLLGSMSRVTRVSLTDIYNANHSSVHSERHNNLVFIGTIISVHAQAFVSTLRHMVISNQKSELSLRAQRPPLRQPPVLPVKWRLLMLLNWDNTSVASWRSTASFPLPECDNITEYAHGDRGVTITSKIASHYMLTIQYGGAHN